MYLNTTRNMTFLAALFALFFALNAAAAELNDRHALEGVKET